MTTVYYTCSFVPAELIAACGCEPQRLIPSIENSLFSQTEGVCSFTQSWLDVLTKNSLDTDRVVVFTTSCDQMRRAFDVYHRRAANKAFLLNIPSTTTPETLDYYSQELKRLKDFLCEVSSNSFDESRLKHLMLDHVPDKDKPAGNNGLNIAFTGGPVSASLYNAVILLLQAYNGKVCLDATEDKLIRRHLKFRPDQIQQNPFRELTRAYFQLPAIWKRPNDTFYNWLSLETRKKNIDGIILFRHLFCDMWHGEVYEFKHRLDIPVLDIHLDGTSTLSAWAVSRIQSFMEMLV
jgi:benzoyl-CoA reductase/2-hydroxyglutaryl-CoA dehydratase subunit BcrC/BadD/HgdB